MSIVSSTLTLGHAQVDGRKYCTERHTDSGGAVHLIEYLSAVGADTNAIMLARVPRIEADLADGECVRVLSVVASLVLSHQTAAQLASKVRERYRTASREQLAQLAWWLIKMINAGFLTDAQVRTAFGMTTPVFTTFKSTKLVPAHDAWAAVLAAVGE